jgi:hypothetical protein
MTPQPSNQLAGALGTGREWRHRLLFHHLPLALVSAAPSPPATSPPDSLPSHSSSGRQTCYYADAIPSPPRWLATPEYGPPSPASST